MARKRSLTSRGAQRLGERERALGLDASDEAARWLDEHDPDPEPEPPKAAAKSKVRHRWQQAHSGAAGGPARSDKTLP